MCWDGSMVKLWARSFDMILPFGTYVVALSGYHFAEGGQDKGVTNGELVALALGSAVPILSVRKASPTNRSRR